MYYQDPTLQGDFDKYCGRTVFHLTERLEGNQYLDVLRILVPLTGSPKFQAICLCSTD